MKSFLDFGKQLNEVLSKSADISTWISDFVHSDDPKFKGKSKAERIEMAKGAYYAAQRNEAVKQPNGTDKITVECDEDPKNKREKANVGAAVMPAFTKEETVTESAADVEFRIDHRDKPKGDVQSTMKSHEAKHSFTSDKATYVHVPWHKADSFKSSMKKHHGVSVEINEETLDEISKDTLRSYANKAFAHGNELHYDIDHTKDKDEKAKLKAKLSKRNDGVIKAAQKMNKEDMDEAVDTVKKDASGKVIAWSHEGDWEKMSTKKQGQGKAANLAGKALQQTKKLAKEEVELDEAAWGKDKMTNLRQAHDRHMEKALAANKAGDDEACKTHQRKMQMIQGKMQKLKQNEEVELGEECEILFELDKKTLGSYVNKAHDQLMKHTSTVATKFARGDSDAFAYSHDKEAVRKTTNRTQGVKTAINKLTKEEVDTKYNQKPKQCGRCSGKLVPNGKKMVCNKCGDTWPNHVLTKEEVEQVDNLAMSEDYHQQQKEFKGEAARAKNVLDNHKSKLSSTEHELVKHYHNFVTSKVARIDKSDRVKAKNLIDNIHRFSEQVVEYAGQPKDVPFDADKPHAPVAKAGKSGYIEESSVTVWSHPTKPVEARWNKGGPHTVHVGNTVTKHSSEEAAIAAAKRKAAALKEQFDDNGNLVENMLTYTQFMQQLDEIKADDIKDKLQAKKDADWWGDHEKAEKKSPVRKVQGHSYGAGEEEGEDDEEGTKKVAKPDAVKRGRGRPAGSKSGARV